MPEKTLKELYQELRELETKRLEATLRMNILIEDLIEQEAKRKEASQKATSLLKQIVDKPD